MSQNAKARSHHHGDLRNALVSAGLALLEEGGTDALTLRGCATRAGVSHAAPKHHFASVKDLRIAVAEACFKRFTGFMAEAAEKGPKSPRGRLKSICQGYLTFALKEPAFFDAIFSPGALQRGLVDFDAGPGTAYGTLRSACAPFVPRGEDPEIVETQVWSLIHGYTLLVRMGRFENRDEPASPLNFGPFDDVMALLDKIGTTPDAT